MPNLHFKLIKTDTHGDFDVKTYVKWGLVIMFFGISTTSFLVQSFLTVKDYVFGSGSNLSMMSSDNLYPSDMDQNRALGSDDAMTASNHTQSDFRHEYSLLNLISLPKTSAQSYLVADVDTGEIVVEKKEDLVAPVASVTKLMTALVAQEKMDLQKIAIVSRDAYNTYGGQGNLRLGDKIKIFDLLYPVLMESSNDGTEVVAEAYDGGRNAFMLEMNKKAKELQMFDTYYDDPSGLSPKNVSTVRDLLKLGRYIYQKHPSLYDMTRVRQYSILGRTWNNQNRLLNYNTFLGGKNGFIDQAKKTTVSLFEVPLAKGGTRKIIVVILRSDDREGDVLKLIDYLKKDVVYNPSI
jgi:D-alanyl-D-alanine carboxypeptidase